MLLYKVYYFTKNIILQISKYDMLNIQYFVIKVHNGFDWPFLFIHADIMAEMYYTESILKSINIVHQVVFDCLL